MLRMMTISNKCCVGSRRRFSIVKRSMCGRQFHLLLGHHGRKWRYIGMMRKGVNLLTSFPSFMVILSRGGSSNFKWSKDSEGWGEPEVQHCMSCLGKKAVQFDGRAFHPFVDGKKTKKTNGSFTLPMIASSKNSTQRRVNMRKVFMIRP